MATPDMAAVRKQVEYYMCDANLASDRFFREKIAESGEGWLDMKYVLSCQKIMILGAKKEHILESLKESPLETKEEGEAAFLRRTDALPAFVPKTRVGGGKDEKADPHYGGVVLICTVPEGTTWNVVKTAAQGKLPGGVKVEFATSLNKKVVLMTAPIPNCAEAFKDFKLALPEDKEAIVVVAQGQELRDALKTMPSHVVKKRESRAAMAKKARDVAVVLGGKRFPSLTQVRGFCREVLSARPKGSVLKHESTEFKVVRDLLKFHPKADEKTSNLKDIKVDVAEKAAASTDEKKSRCFWVVRESGEAEDFSMLKCMDEMEKQGGGWAKAVALPKAEPKKRARPDDKEVAKTEETKAEAPKEAAADDGKAAPEPAAKKARTEDAPAASAPAASAPAASA